jgi:hypothetical protein
MTARFVAIFTRANRFAFAAAPACAYQSFPEHHALRNGAI